MKKLAILSSLILLALNSCSNEEIFNEEFPNNFEKRITVVAEDLTPAEGTRTSYTDNGNGYSFAWAEGDALGIFPENGYQTAFPIGTDGVGSNTAVFDGGKWALRPNESYAAYYPLIHDFDLDPSAIPFDYTGQVQDGNGSTAHLSKYDFMASAFEKVDDKGNVNFQLQHLGCLVQFKLTMPEADTFSSLEIVSDNAPFITSGEYSLSDNEHKLQNVATSSTVTIGLKNISTADDKTELIITAMFAPVDLSGSNLTLNVTGTKGIYSFNVEGQDLTQGKSINHTWAIPYVTFHAEDEQSLTMSMAVPTLEYSVDGAHWAELGTNTIVFGGSHGDLRIRGKSTIGTAEYAVNFSTITFGSQAKVSCSGDIRTLVDYENFNTTITSRARFMLLFQNCDVLTNAPDLPATDLAEKCYYGMFQGCTSLTSAPELPATTLASSCYDSMFQGCTSLTSAPELPARYLTRACYIEMFAGCTSLTSVKMLAIDISAEYCLDDWLKDVAPTGTFVKEKTAQWTTIGTSGVPEGWNIMNNRHVIKPNDAISGLFSVGDNKQVWFSKGNLQYTYGSGVYSFADYQYEIVGNTESNRHLDYLAGSKADLFGWSGTSWKNYGNTNTTTSGYYGGDFYEWGRTIDNIATWRTLSEDEWRYLFGNSKERNGKYRNWVIVNDIHGVVVAPDNYTGTIQDSYDVSAWADAEKDGLVFLPAAGRRLGAEDIAGINMYGYYWTSTTGSQYSNKASCAMFSENKVEVASNIFERRYGYSVRLVSDYVE